MATFKLENLGPAPLGSTLGIYFEAKLKNAISSSPPGSIIDCSSYTGRIDIKSTIVITKSLTILLGNCYLNYLGDSDMFQIKAPNVKLYGVSRSTENTTDSGSTTLRFAYNNRGYHIFCGQTDQLSGERSGWGSNSGLEIKNIDFVGFNSVITEDEGYPIYTTRGSGGIIAIAGSPFTYCRSISDVVVENITMNGCKHYGLFMMGAANAKISNITIYSAPIHGIYMLQSKQSIIDTCNVSGVNLAGIFLDRSNNISVTSCKSIECGLGYWVKASKSCTLDSCLAKDGLVRSTQPYDNGVDFPGVHAFRIDDIGTPYINIFKGTGYLISGTPNYGPDTTDVNGSFPYGYTGLGDVLTPLLLSGTGETSLPCGEGCPAGFKCSDDGYCMPDLSSQLWKLSNYKPSGGAIYNGPSGQSLHTGWGDSGFQLHTGWGDAQDYRIYGNCDPTEGYISVNSLNFRQIITSDLISNVSCPGGDECPTGFICDGGVCVPDVPGPTWTLIGNKPGGGGPVYVHTSGVQFHTGWGEAEDLVQKLYYNNNEDITDFTSVDNTVISCESVTPGKSLTSAAYINETTAHFIIHGASYRNNIISPKIKGYATKFAVRVTELDANSIPDANFINIPDPSVNSDNPEPANFDYLRINDVLNQGSHTTFGTI
jgi:parallel beta-helix repeat protein